MTGVGLVAACTALLLAPLPGRAIEFAPGIPLSASDTEWHRPPIAISGDFSVAGVSGYGDPGAPPIIPDLRGSGTAYVFEHHVGSEVVEHQLIASDAARNDAFGTSVAISGLVAVVGAPYAEESPNSQNTGLAYVFRYDGASWVEEDRLIADDGLGSDHFGSSVAISGDTILVGSPKGFGRVDPGSVYVFRYDGESWIQEDQITSSDAAADDDFGEIIAISGDTAVVGVPDDDATSDLGTVYVYRYNGVNDWVEEEKLTVPADSAQAPFGASFGESLAVSGDTLLVGAYRGFDDAQARVGAVYVYRYDGVGSWEEEAKLTGEGLNYNFHFGRSVALEGDFAVIGTKGGTFSEGPGLAYVFWNDGAGWVEQDRLVGDDADFGTSVAISGTTALAGFTSSAIYLFRNIPDAKLIAEGGAQSDRFGSAVSLHGDTALVGAPDDDDKGNSSGSAYLYWYDGANWLDDGKLTAYDGAEDERFGTAVDIAGRWAVVGASGSELSPGAAYVFEDGGASWGEGEKLVALHGAPNDEFGRSVAVSGDTVVVGAPSANAYAGAAYAFSYNGASWGQQVELTASDGAPDQEFGTSVGISGDTIVVGAPAHDIGDSAGAAYVFRFDGATWIQAPPLTASDGAARDGFGSSVAISSDTIVVIGGSAAYVFGYDGEDSAEETKLTPSDSATVDRFGTSVDISEDRTVVVGSELDDTWTGSANVFWFDGSGWLEEPRLIPSDSARWDFFGKSVSISGDMVLVGASENDDFGAAYVSTVHYESVPEPSLVALEIAALAALALVRRRRACR